jgi:phosphoserine phosphatase RsbU/P
MLIDPCVLLPHEYALSAGYCFSSGVAHLSTVIAERRASSPEQAFETAFDLTEHVDCDGGRVAQLFSNPLGKAFAHGTAAQPIRVHAATLDSEFELSVANSGEPIPAEAMDRRFQPFYRLPDRNSQQGLGLGLYIASEIARTWNTSSPQETQFTFRMPL